jgi:hypothetical protein
MEPFIFVSRVVITRLLQLLVCIAVEAWVLKRALAISPKTSVEYAAAINLLAHSISWLIFFTLEPIAPNLLKQQLIINLTLSINDVSLFFMGFRMLSFLMFLVIKWQALELVRFITAQDATNPAATIQQGYQFRIMVKAHTMSHVLILLIFLIKQIEMN